MRWTLMVVGAVAVLAALAIPALAAAAAVPAAAAGGGSRQGTRVDLCLSAQIADAVKANPWVSAALGDALTVQLTQRQCTAPAPAAAAAATAAR